MSMLKPGVSYLNAFVGGHNELKQMYMYFSQVEECPCKKQSTEHGVIDISKQELKKTCAMCKKNYRCEEDEIPRVFYEVKKIVPPKDTIFFGSRYNKVKSEMFFCRDCARSVDSCSMCGKKFLHNSLQIAYDDPILSKMTEVCLSCYNLEACAGCGYLGGASPCRWCR